MAELIINQDNLLKVILAEDLRKINACMNYGFDWYTDIFIGIGFIKTGPEYYDR